MGALSLLLATLAMAADPASSAGRPDTSKMNVLFIAIDDLNHWVGYTGRNPQTRTPNIDRLSKMGTSFTHAYCAAPLCNPSRAALMSGMRPGTTGCYLNEDNWKQFIPEGRGLSNAFKQAGYYVVGAGKIYHSSSYYPSEWDDYFNERGLSRFGSEEDKATTKGSKGIDKEEGFQIPVAHDLKDEDLADWHITSYCIEQLGKKHDKPFFLACGLHKPHLPWVVPRKYYDLFPVETIQLPPYKEDDLDDLPAAGVRIARPEGDHKRILESGRWKEAIRSYLACAAYTDMNVGRLLDAFEKSKYRDNTIIVFWGDHGWHLGEKHHWRKFTLWEEATRAPLIWVVPGLTKGGTICERTVDFMSIYPTLCDLAGIAKPEHVQGVSVRSLLADPQTPWTTPAVITFGYQNHAVRTEGWRYIRYADNSEELYNEVQDPYEWTNLTASDQAPTRIKELSEWLPKDNKPSANADKKAKKANRENRKAKRDKGP